MIQNCKIYNCSAGGDMDKTKTVSQILIRVEIDHQDPKMRSIYIAVDYSTYNQKDCWVVVPNSVKDVCREIKKRITKIEKGDPEWNL